MHSALQHELRVILLARQSAWRQGGMLTKSLGPLKRNLRKSSWRGGQPRLRLIWGIDPIRKDAGTGLYGSRPEPARENRKGRLMICSRDRINMLRKVSTQGMIFAGAAALILSAGMPLALAQTQGQTPGVPKTSQAPKVQGAPAAPAGAPAAGGAPDDAWVKLCMKSEQTQNKQICLINHEGLEPNTGMVLIAAAVRQAEGEDKQQLLIRVPTAYALVIPAGVQVKIDDNQPIQLQYTLCFPTSCQVQMELSKEMMDSMRKGKQMVVAAMNIQQKTMGFPVPLTGFAKAYDGPPVD